MLLGRQVVPRQRAGRVALQPRPEALLRARPLDHLIQRFRHCCPPSINEVRVRFLDHALTAGPLDCSCHVIGPPLVAIRAHYSATLGSASTGGKRPVALGYRPVVRTTRKRAPPLIMRAYASGAWSSGYSSITGRTACKSLKARVSAMS